MGQPLVSIIISNYNYSRYLVEAIDSVVRQTYPRIEVIVVDDGSTDNSREVILGYGGRIIPIFKENGGQASAFNAGFRVSRGELVCFMDSDDKWLPEKVAKVVRIYERLPDTALIYHRVQPVNDSGSAIGKPWPTTVMCGCIRRRVARSGGWWPYPPTSALCFNRDYLEAMMSIPEHQFRICADAYLGDLVPFLGRVFGLRQVLSYYRLHGGNQWNSWTRLGEEREAVRTHAAHYEVRVKALNDALERLGLAERVSLRDHWPYQRLRWKLGEEVSLLLLTLLVLRFPAEPGLWRRLKNAGKLWLEAAGLRGTR